MNRKASVTMKEGSRVRMTICPFRPPSTRRDDEGRGDGERAAASR